MIDNHPDLEAMPLPGEQLVMPRIIPPQDDRLATILQMAKTLGELEDQRALKSQELEVLEQRIKDLSERQLPDTMGSIGLTELRLANGDVISIKEDIYASVPKARSAQAFQWLREHNMGGVIKTENIVDESHFVRLREAGIPFETKESIHPSTLKALVREQLEGNNANFPRELFGVHVVNRAVHKTATT